MLFNFAKKYFLILSLICSLSTNQLRAPNDDCGSGCACYVASILCVFLLASNHNNHQVNSFDKPYAYQVPKNPCFYCKRRSCNYAGSKKICYYPTQEDMDKCIIDCKKKLPKQNKDN